MSDPWLTVIVPCYNEEQAVLGELARLREALARQGACEIVVVDDGSTDATAARLDEAVAQLGPGAAISVGAHESMVLHAPGSLKVVRHRRNQGYGAALKTGLRQARGDWILIADADGSYPLEAIPEMVATIAEADMVVGRAHRRRGRLSAHAAVREVVPEAGAAVVRRAPGRGHELGLADLPQGPRAALLALLPGRLQLHHYADSDRAGQRIHRALRADRVPRAGGEVEDPAGEATRCASSSSSCAPGSTSSRCACSCR